MEAYSPELEEEDDEEEEVVAAGAAKVVARELDGAETEAEAGVTTGATGGDFATGVMGVTTGATWDGFATGVTVETGTSTILEE